MIEFGHYLTNVQQKQYYFAQPHGFWIFLFDDVYEQN